MLALLLASTAFVQDAKTDEPKKPPKRGIRNGDVEMGIPWAAVTYVGYHGGVSGISADGPYLLVVVMLTNKSNAKKINFSGLQSVRGLSMTDDVGNTYRRIEHVGGGAPLHQVNDDSALYPGKPLIDVVVFERPVAAAKELTLLIPGSAVSEDDPFKFTFTTDQVPTAGADEVLDDAYFVDNPKAAFDRRGRDKRRAAYDDRMKRDREAAEKEIADAKKAALDRAKEPITGMELVSIIGKGSKATALVRLLPSKRTSVVKAGQALNGWTIKSLDAERGEVKVTTPKGELKTLPQSQPKKKSP